MQETKRAFPSRAVRPGFIMVMALCVGTLSGCAALGLGGFNLVSIEEEWQLGRQIEAEINQQLPLSRDATVVNYVNRIGQDIVARTDMANLPWRFYVVESDEVNAFNAPGGLVYIYTGLIREASNASELIGVIGHEVAHGVARHGTQRLSQHYGIAVLASVVLGQDPGILSQIVAQLIHGGAMAQFSQRQELEADQMGVRFMTAIGYNPQGLVTFFERLQEMRERQPGAVERFFATHPPTPRRIEHVRAEIQRTPGTDNLPSNDGQFANVRARVR
jgi:beta-barrel assembly-enhancing protease